MRVQTLTPDISQGESGPPTENSVPPSGGFQSHWRYNVRDRIWAERINDDLQLSLQRMRRSVSMPKATSMERWWRAAPPGTRDSLAIATLAPPEADIIYVQTSNGDNYVFCG